MLPAAHRMRDSESFRSTIRAGVKAVQPDLVVHLSDATAPTDTSSVGFVVSKAIGNAVVRSRVKRQLRHSIAAEIHQFRSGYRVVVRAFPSAAGKPSDELHREIRAGLQSAQEKLAR